MQPHRFIPSETPDWDGAHRFCAQCDMPQQHRIHQDYTDTEGDRSDAILGERDTGDAAA